MTTTLATYAATTETTSHTINFGQASTPGRTVVAIVDSVAVVTTPAGWTKEQLWIDETDFVKFTLPAASHTAPLSSLVLNVASARFMTCWVFEDTIVNDTVNWGAIDRQVLSSTDGTGWQIVSGDAGVAYFTFNRASAIAFDAIAFTAGWNEIAEMVTSSGGTGDTIGTWVAESATAINLVNQGVEGFFTEDLTGTSGRATVFGYDTSGGDATPPGPVTGLTATPANTSVALSWTNPGDGDLSQIVVRGAQSATPPATITDGYSVSTALTTGVSDTGLTPSTNYSYSIWAVDTSNNESTRVTVSTTTTSDVTPPGPITGLTATPTDTSVALSWINPGDGDLSQIVVRGAQSATPPATITDGYNVSTALVTGVSNTGLTPSTDYSYSVWAVDASNNASTRVTVSTTTTAPDTTPPGPITGLTATPADTSVALSWTNPGDGDLSQIVVRGAQSATPPATITDGYSVSTSVVTGVSNTGLTPSTDYSYSIWAVDASSNASTRVTVSTTTIAAEVIGQMRIWRDGVGWVSIGGTGGLIDDAVTSLSTGWSSSRITEFIYELFPERIPAPTFMTGGATFQPEIELLNGSGATVTWVDAADGTTLGTGLAPVLSFGTAEPRSIKMVVTGGNGYADVTTVNVGYDYSIDTGLYMTPASYNKTAEVVTGMTNMTLLTGLVRMLAQCPGIDGHMDLSGLSELEFAEFYSSQISSIDLTGCTSLIRLNSEESDLTTLDLNPVAGNLYDLRSAYMDGRALHFTTLTQPLANLYHFCTRGQTMTNMPPPEQMPVVTDLWVWDCVLSGELHVPPNSNYVEAYRNDFTSVTDVGRTYTLGGLLNLHGNLLTSATLTTHWTEVRFYNNNFDQAGVDSVLSQIEAWGTNGGALQIQGNVPPSAAGLANIAILESRGWTITSDAPTDTTPPGPVTGLTVGTITFNTIPLSWTNPVDVDLASIVVRYAAGATPPATTISGTGVTVNPITNTSTTVTGLTQSTEYSISVFAVDGSGNPSTATTTTQTTVSSGDATPPGPVTGLNATPADHSVTLNWTNPGDGDLSQIIVRGAQSATPPVNPTDGYSVSTALTTTATDTGLAPATNYSYSVWAVDTSTNESTRVTVSTTTAADITPPGPVTGLTVGTVTDTAISLSWTNPVDSDYASAIVRYAAGATAPATAVAGIGAPSSPVASPGTGATITGLTAETQYSFSVFAQDDSGNVSTVASDTATTASAGSAVVLWQDTFDRANATGAANVGNGWTMTISASSDINIVNNNLQINGTSGYSLVTNMAGGILPADYTMVWNVPDASILNFSGVCGRFDPNQGDGIRVLWPVGSDRTTAPSIGNSADWANDNQTVTIVNNYPASWSLNQDHEIRVDFHGNVIDIWCDGQHAYTCTYSRNSAETGNGIGISGEAQMREYYDVTVYEYGTY